MSAPRVVDQHAGTVEAPASAAPAASSTGVRQQPECYVIVYNVSKKHNVGTLLRSCTAFGVKEVCLVGSRQYNCFGSHGADAHVQLRHFHTIEECCTWLKHTSGCRILGVEIDPSAQPVQQHPFTGNTAFMLGNEGQGLSQKQMQLCDGFVYIPQHGQGTASLNVTVAASIILHHFAVWASYPERQRDGAKFVVEPKPLRTTARGQVPRSPEELAALQEQRRAAGAQAAAADSAEEWVLQVGGLEGLVDAPDMGQDIQEA